MREPKSLRRSGLAALCALVSALVAGPGPRAGSSLLTADTTVGGGILDYSAAWDDIDQQIDLTGLWGSINPVLDADPVAITRPVDQRLFLFWGQWDGIDRDIVYATRPAGGTWSGPVPVTVDNQWNDVSPSLLIDGGGYLNVAWTRLTDAGGVVLHAIRIGGLWTPPERISGTEDSRNPVMRLDNNCRLVTFRTPTLRTTVEVVVYVGAGVSDDIDPTRVESYVKWHEVLPK